MPKIAYLTPHYFSDESIIGGGERYPTNLAKGVSKASNGHFQIELISFGPSSRRVELAPNVVLRVLPAANPKDDPLNVLSWDLPEALADADLVHIHQIYTRCSEVGLLVAKGLGKVVCLTNHGAETSNIGQHYGMTVLADRIVAYSDFGASFFRDKPPVEVIKGGVDADAFTPSPHSLVRTHILYVGRLLPHKGIDRLIRAVPNDMPLVLCGRPYRAEYYDQLRELAHGKDVRFVTDANDEIILDLYRRAWATVLPSVHQDCYGDYYATPELMGLTLLESMACGTPAIASNLAAMPEFIRHGETGFLFDTIEELSSCLNIIAYTPGLSEQMGIEARRSLEIEFSLDVAGARMARLYTQLLSDIGRREVAA